VSITVEDASSASTDGPEGLPPPPAAIDPTRRGTTTVATSAVERVAGWVAASTPGVSAADLTGIRGWFHGDDDTAETDVDTGDGGLCVSVTVAVAYPEPIAEVTAQVRRRISTTLREQMGVSADRIDVTVTELRRTSPDRITLRDHVR
jgi:uncharacterized alkaline shock family protein YloU